MKVIGVGLTDLEKIAGEVGVRLYGGGWTGPKGPKARTRKDGRPEVSFTLRTLYSEKRAPVAYRRLGTPRPGRKTRTIGGILCWHGHRDFMALMFERFPSAILTSAIAKYEGREGFERAHGATAYQNIGSQAFPCSLKDACFCGVEGYDSRGLPR